MREASSSAATMTGSSHALPIPAMFRSGMNAMRAMSSILIPDNAMSGRRKLRFFIHSTVYCGERVSSMGRINSAMPR